MEDENTSAVEEEPKTIDDEKAPRTLEEWRDLVIRVRQFFVDIGILSP